MSRRGNKVSPEAPEEFAPVKPRPRRLSLSNPDASPPPPVLELRPTAEAARYEAQLRKARRRTMPNEEDNFKKVRDKYEQTETAKPGNKGGQHEHESPKPKPSPYPLSSSEEEEPGPEIQISKSQQEVFEDLRNKVGQRFLKEYEQAKAHQIEKAKQIMEERKKKQLADHQKYYETITPYWILEMDKGGKHLEKHRRAHERVRAEIRKMEKEEGKKKIIYVTSGTPDLSLCSSPTSHLSVLTADIPPNLSPELKHLAPLDSLFLTHKMYVRDAFFEWSDEVETTFFWLNNHGHKVFVLRNKQKGCVRSREFMGEDFADGTTPFRFMFFRFGFNHRRCVQVFCPAENNLIGSVEHKWCPIPYFEVMGGMGALIAKIKLLDNRCCGVGPAKRKVFKAYCASTGKVLGEIRGNCENLMPYLFTRNQHLGVFFNRDLDVTMKLLFLGAAKLIYKAFYEGKLAKVVTHDPKPKLRRFFEIDEFMALHPSYCSSIGTIKNWEQPLDGNVVRTWHRHVPWK